MHKLTSEQFKVMPWRNGLGFTTELYRLNSGDDMMFRISMAKVAESGPFSDFSGYDRTLVNLGPGVMNLTMNARPKSVLSPLQVIHFDGSWPVHCEVTASSEDLNIFCRQSRYFASTCIHLLAKPEFIPLLPGTGLFILVLEGQLCAQDADGREILINRHEALLHEPDSKRGHSHLMLVSASDTICSVAVISFRPI
jgi:environmental stress-induced protein Ves